MSAIADFGVSLLILWRLRTRGLREIRPKPVGRLDLPTGATRVHAPHGASRKAANYQRKSLKLTVNERIRPDTGH